jgi:hypothetical protein
MVLPLLRSLRSPTASALLRRSLATPTAAPLEASSSGGAATAVGAGRVPGGPGSGTAGSKLFDDYDETTAEGHAMIDKERDVLAFMRTVELELPRLVRASAAVFLRSEAPIQLAC